MAIPRSPNRSNFTQNVAPGTTQGGVMAALERELNILHERIDQLQNELEYVRRYADIPPGKEQYRTLTVEEVQAMYGNQTAPSPKAGKKITVGELREHFIDKLTNGELPKEEKKEELHPAANSSFVLKI